MIGDHSRVTSVSIDACCYLATRWFREYNLASPSQWRRTTRRAQALGSSVRAENAGCEGIYELSCFGGDDNDSDGVVDCEDLD